MKKINLVSELSIPNEDRAMEVFRGIKWTNGVYCPECNSFSVYKR